MQIDNQLIGAEESNLATVKSDLSIKAQFNGELRRFELRECSWDVLNAKIRELFNIENLALAYVDEEGEKISFNTTEELALAFSLTNGAALRIFVKDRDAKSEDIPGQHRSRQQQRREERNERKLERKRLQEEKRKRRLEEKENRKAERICKCKKSRLQGADAAAEDGMEDDGKKGKKRERRQERKEKRERTKRERKPKLEKANYVEVSEEILSEITHIYLDGNNMLYLTSALRKLSVHRKIRQAEALLEAATQKIIQSLSSASPPFPSKLREVVLIFDSTPTNKTQMFETSQENAIRFVVRSARPDFPSSDDALICWASSEEDKQIVASSLFVTSDRALAAQLAQAGGILATPKHFLRFFCSKIANPSTPEMASEIGEQSDIKQESLDCWLEGLVSDMQSFTLATSTAHPQDKGEV